MNNQSQVSKGEPKKYTVREVLDSLYWETRDADENYDGFLHLVSSINGMEQKIDIKQLIDSVIPGKDNVTL